MFGMIASSVSQESQALLFVQKIGDTQLLAYVDALEPKLSQINLEGNRIPKSFWDPKFAENGVLDIKWMIDGLFIVLSTEKRNEEGIFVRFRQSDESYDGSGVSFTKISDRIYGLIEKVRQPAVR